VTRPESLKPQAATLPEASSEIDAAVTPMTTLAPAADGESGEAESTTAQIPRTARGRGEPARTAAAPRTAKESPLPKAAFDAGRSRPGPVASKTSPSVAETPAPWTAPSTVTPSSEAVWPEASILTPVTTAPAPERSELWMNPAAPQPGTQEPGHDAPLEDEDVGHPPSRLSGLRNMLVSLGRRSLIEDEEGSDEADPEPRFERATVRPAYNEPPTGEAAASAPAPVRVTAPPEFLPPKPAAEAEKEKEPLRPTPPVPRRERETPDEIQTLPSWRGQYRKKRYPPI
jgi:hypothetical protein